MLALSNSIITKFNLFAEETYDEILRQKRAAKDAGAQLSSQEIKSIRQKERSVLDEFYRRYEDFKVIHRLFYSNRLTNKTRFILEKYQIKYWWGDLKAVLRDTNDPVNRLAVSLERTMKRPFTKLESIHIKHVDSERDKTEIIRKIRQENIEKISFISKEREQISTDDKDNEILNRLEQIYTEVVEKADKLLDETQILLDFVDQIEVGEEEDIDLPASKHPRTSNCLKCNKLIF